MKKVMSLYLISVFIFTLSLITGCTYGKNIESNDMEFELGNNKVELKLENVLSKKVKLLLPTSFNIMSDEVAKTKYPSERRPTIIYTNESGSVNIALNYTKNKATSSEISEYIDKFKKTFENQYPSAQWYKSGIEKINGKDVGVLELITPAIDTEIYNLMWFTDLDDRLLLSTFNCTKEQMNDWQQIAKRIMYSQQLE